MLSKSSHGEERGKLGVTINVVFGLLFVMTSSLASATAQYSVDATNSCGGDTSLLPEPFKGLWTRRLLQPRARRLFWCTPEPTTKPFKFGALRGI